ADGEGRPQSDAPLGEEGDAEEVRRARLGANSGIVRRAGIAGGRQRCGCAPPHSNRPPIPFELTDGRGAAWARWCPLFWCSVVASGPPWWRCSSPGDCPSNI